MPDHKLCVPCLFGLEGPLGNELRHMGLRDVMPENGRVRCTGTDADIARMNIRCRFGERVLLELGSFPAPTFDALFEGVKALPWADYLPADAAFPVKGYSLESALHSVPDCQKIIKKAVVESLKRRYRVNWFAETGALYQIQFSLVHDTATLYLDTTGTPLHKRGYRPARRRGRLHHLRGGGRARIRADDRPRRHRHESALRRAPHGKARGRGALHRLRHGLCQNRALAALPPELAHGV